MNDNYVSKIPMVKTMMNMTPTVKTAKISLSSITLDESNDNTQASILQMKSSPRKTNAVEYSMAANSVANLNTN